jgi:UDP-GlcNAc:undecaprenyl-phosphate GlcNAc-1-phosphate transferase
MIFFIGLYDDFKPFTPVAKLVGQILATTMVISMGYTSSFFTPRIPDNILAQLPNILLTFVWLVGITNALNLLDNMDGLAGGISLITSCVLAYFFWRAGNISLLWISLALAGSVLGFLFFNFPPAKIFMGDSGSLFLGFTLAVLAIAQQHQASDVFAVVGVPTLLFLLPILDTILVTFTRLLRGQSPIRGGRDHTSHRLIAFGLSERQALLVLYVAALSSAILAAGLESLNYWLSLALAPLLMVSLALLTAYLGRIKIVKEEVTQKHPVSSSQGKVISRLMVDITYRGRLFEVVLDFFLIGIAYYLAFLTRYGRAMDHSSLALYLVTLPIALAAAYLSFFVSGIYRNVWRYVDFDDVLRYLMAALGSLVLLAGAIFLVDELNPELFTRYSSSALEQMSFSSPMILLFFTVYLFMGLAASRSSFKILDLFFQQRSRRGKQPVLIIGAGDEGEMALRWILMNPDLNYRPVGFLDENPLIAGRQIHGVKVLGSLRLLGEILESKGIQGVILAGVDRDAEVIDEIFSICHTKNCWIRRLWLDFELMAETYS